MKYLAWEAPLMQMLQVLDQAKNYASLCYTA